LLLAPQHPAYRLFNDNPVRPRVKLRRTEYQNKNGAGSFGLAGGYNRAMPEVTKFRCPTCDAEYLISDLLTQPACTTEITGLSARPHAGVADQYLSGFFDLRDAGA
jgi:hypothetical protein